MFDPYSLFIRNLSELKGHIVPEEEFEVFQEITNLFRCSVEKNLTWFLESISKYKTIVGFFLAVAEKKHRDESIKLKNLVSVKYTNQRKTGLSSKIGKSPPAEALKNVVQSDPEILHQSMITSNAEFRRDILRELRSALSSKSSEVDQISNNLRLEIRMESD